VSKSFYFAFGRPSCCRNFYSVKTTIHKNINKTPTRAYADIQLQTTPMRVYTPVLYSCKNKTIVLFTKYVKNCRKIIFFLSNSGFGLCARVYVYANNFKSVLVRLNARTPWKKNCSCTIINQRNFRTISIRKIYVSFDTP